jgi:hypothetical protein
VAEFFFDSNDASGSGGGVFFSSNDASASVPIITGTNNANPRHTGSLVINCSNASAAGNTVTLGGIEQVITAEAEDQITITVGRGTNKYGVSLALVITSADDASSEPFVVSSLLPPVGWAFVDLGTLIGSGLRITAIADLASGNQLGYETVGNTVVVFPDGHVEIVSGYSSPVEFDVEAWVTGDGWGAVGTQEFIDIGTLLGCTIPLDNENSVPLAATSIDWFVMDVWAGEVTNFGTTLTDGSGNLNLINLTGHIDGESAIVFHRRTGNALFGGYTPVVLAATS